MHTAAVKRLCILPARLNVLCTDIGSSDTRFPGIDGGAGGDILTGDGGEDKLVGGPGVDHGHGGAGDTCIKTEHDTGC